MKELTSYFRDEKDIIFKDFEKIEPKSLGSRKKIDIYATTSVEKHFIAIFKVDAKSRFLRKNANDLEELFEKLKEYKNHNFKKKFLLISSPLCSKAKALLEENSWTVDEVKN